MQDQAGAIDWDDFRFLLAIVRGGSVSAAAKQLGVDHATVIRRVDRLERHLGAKLFDRRKTGYLLTEAGQRVADSAEAMESTIVANQEAVGGSRAHLTGTVRIGAPDGFGSHFLASRLLQFTERYPDLDLQLVATARLFSLSKREADIAISLTMPKEGRVVGRKLLDYSLGLYAAPAYLDRHPTIASRDDLPAHRFVGYIEELLFTPELDYLPQVSPKISAKFRSANLIAQLNATIAGFGIAVLPHFMATAHPELRPILPDEISISRSFWLLMHADSKDLARIRAVADYIYETVERERALFNRPELKVGKRGVPTISAATWWARCAISPYAVRDFFAGLAGGARPSTASRPAPRISSENSPDPAMRASTSVPIMVAIAPSPACARPCAAIPAPDRRACRSSAPAWTRTPCGFSGSRGRFPARASGRRSHGRDRRDAASVR